MSRDQAAQPSGSYAQAAGGNRHDLKGYYRFLNSEREELNLESLLHTHRTQTIRRMKRESTVLIVQDTTELNFSTRSACEGLGQIGTNQTGAQSRGLDLHSCLAVGESGLPLGVLRLDGYAPEPAQGKDPHRPIEEKESYRWLEAYQDACLIAAHDSRNAGDQRDRSGGGHVRVIRSAAATDGPEGRVVGARQV